MAFIKADRVKEVSNSVGTSPMVLGGAVTQYRSWSTVMADGDKSAMLILSIGTADWEICWTTYTAATNSLSRDTLIAGSNGASRVNFASGVKYVSMIYTAAEAVVQDSNGDSSVGRNLTVVGTYNGYTPASSLDLTSKPAARAATGGPLPACTYNNGTLGVGATLTATANGALTVDTTPLQAGTFAVTVATNGFGGIEAVQAVTASKTYRFGIWLKLGTLTGTVTLVLKDGAQVSQGGSASFTLSSSTWTYCEITSTFTAGTAANVWAYVDPANNTPTIGMTMFAYGPTLIDTSGLSNLNLLATNNFAAGGGIATVSNCTYTPNNTNGPYDVLAVNDIILVKDQAAPLQNGLYNVTVAGDATHAWKLTRHTAVDAPADFVGAFVAVAKGGATNSNTLWMCTPTAIPATVGTTDMVFNSVTAGLGFTPLNAASNLSDLVSATTARTNLGLATVASTGLASSLTGTMATAQLPLLASTKIWVGNGSGVAAAVSVSGDATMTNAGVLTVTKTSGSAFAASAITDTTNANNINAGNLGVLRMPIIASNTLLANATGSAAAAAATSLSTVLDTLGSTQGDILYRSGAGWVALPPGTPGQALVTNGPAANPSWSLGAVIVGDVNGDSVVIRDQGVGRDLSVARNATVAGTLGVTGASTFHAGMLIESATGIPAGGVQDAGLMFSNVAHFGIIFGSGAPTATMHQGSLYLQSDGAPSINISGTNTWAGFVDTASTQTLTNKTLTSPTVNAATITGTVVATTATLTVATQTANDNSTKAASTAYADRVLANLVIRVQKFTSPPTVITVTIATPAVLSWTAHGMAIGQAFQLTTTGALPTGMTASTTYFVITAGFGTNAFQFAATPGGAAINTSGTQSGVHTGTPFYVPSANMIYCTMEGVGGGGGGGGVTSLNAGVQCAAGGGASGNYARLTASATTVGASQKVTIGAAGVGGIGATDVAGTAGGDTSVGTGPLMRARGGGGASGTSGGGSIGGAVGTAGTGDINGRNGQPGGNGGGGNTTNALFYAGSGGGTLFGSGGLTFTGTNGGGIAGLGNGSGGSGAACATATTNLDGGAGTAGLVIITEFCSH